MVRQIPKKDINKAKYEYSGVTGTCDSSKSFEAGVAWALDYINNPKSNRREKSKQKT